MAAMVGLEATGFPDMIPVVEFKVNPVGRFQAEKEVGPFVAAI